MATSAAKADEALLLLEALRLMKQALKNLDDAGAPADIGARQDHAICRLEEFLAETETRRSPTSDF